MRRLATGARTGARKASGLDMVSGCVAAASDSRGDSDTQNAGQTAALQSPAHAVAAGEHAEISGQRRSAHVTSTRKQGRFARKPRCISRMCPALAGGLCANNVVAYALENRRPSSSPDDEKLAFELDEEDLRADNTKGSHGRGFSALPRFVLHHQHADCSRANCRK